MTNVLDLSRNFCYNNNREVKARTTRRTREAMASELQLPQHYVELDEQEMMYVDASEWSSGLKNKVSNTVQAGASINVSINENWFADYITVSYEKEGTRYISYANNLNEQEKTMSDSYRKK